MESRNQYWDMLVNLKSKQIYYQIYHQRAFKRDIYVTTILTIFSFGGISLWMIWDNHPILWAALLFLLQSLQLVDLILPFSKRLLPLQYMVDEMYYLILDIEKDFDSLDIDNPEEIDRLRMNYLLKFNNIEQRYLSGLYMPRINVIPMVNKELDAYFYSKYCMHITTYEGGDSENGKTKT